MPETSPPATEPRTGPATEPRTSPIDANGIAHPMIVIASIMLLFPACRHERVTRISRVRVCCNTQIRASGLKSEDSAQVNLQFSTGRCFSDARMGEGRCDVSSPPSERLTRSQSLRAARGRTRPRHGSMRSACPLMRRTNPRVPGRGPPRCAQTDRFPVRESAWNIAGAPPVDGRALSDARRPSCRSARRARPRYADQHNRRPLPRGQIREAVCILDFGLCGPVHRVLEHEGRWRRLRMARYMPCSEVVAWRPSVRSERSASHVARTCGVVACWFARRLRAAVARGFGSCPRAASGASVQANRQFFAG